MFEKIKSFFTKLGWLIFFALLFALALALIGFGTSYYNPEPGMECIEADDYGDKVRTVTEVLASKNEWTESNLEVSKGAPLQITTTGHVNLCTDENLDNAAISGKTQGVVFERKLNVKTSRWQPLNIVVSKGEEINIKYRGKIAPWGLSHPRCSTAEGCYVDAGGVVNLHIGYPKGGLDGDNDSGKFDRTDPFYNTKNQKYLGNSAYEGEGDRFFKLINLTNYIKNYGTSAIITDTPSGKEIIKTIQAPESGQVYAQVYDAYSSDNGGSAILTFHLSCEGQNGKFLAATVTEDNPNETEPKNIIPLHLFARNNQNPALSGIYNGNSPDKGKIWYKIIDDVAYDWDKDGVGDYYRDNNYDNNFYSYKVETVTRAADHEDLKNFIGEIIKPIKTIMYGNPETDQIGLVRVMFENLTADGGFIRLVQAMMILSITLYGMGFMIGIAGMSTTKDFVSTLVKFSIIIALISPGNWQFFYDYLFVAFIEGLDELIYIVNSQFASFYEPVSGKAQGFEEVTYSAFTFLNYTFERFIFTKEVWIKMYGLFADLPFGIIYAVIIMWGLFIFALGVMNAVMVYLISIIAIGLLLALSPIFISFLLFKQTVSIFKNWLLNLFSFALQPMLLLTTLSIFNIFLYNAITKILSFSVCWTCWHPIVLNLEAAGLGEIELCWMHSYIPWGTSADWNTGDFGNNPTSVSFFTLLIFVIIVRLFEKISTSIPAIANSLTAGGAGAEVGGTAQNIQGQAYDFSKAAVTGTAERGWSFAKGTVKNLSGYNLYKWNEKRKNLGLSKTKAIGRQLNPFSKGLHDKELYDNKKKDK